ncbi:MAG TPA: type II secretion system F family protein [Actinomycetota bacterium]
MRRISALASVLAFPLVFGTLGLGTMGVAFAQTPGDVDVRIREISFRSGGQTSIVASVSGTPVTENLPASAFRVTEQGVEVSDLSVEPLFDTTFQVAVSLLVDVSRSTREVLGSARNAAVEFLAALPPAVRVEVLTFADGVARVSGFTTLGGSTSSTRAALRQAILALQPANAQGTRLHDAVIQATEDLQLQRDSQHNIVVFSDGSDSGSTATLLEAEQAIDAANAATTTVLLRGINVSEAQLQALAEVEEGGTFVPVDDTAALRTAFRGVAQSISSQYLLSYNATATEPADLSIAVEVTVGGITGSDASAVSNRRADVSAPVDEKPSTPFAGVFGNRVGLLVGILGTFLAVALFLGMIIWRPAGKQAEQLLQRGLRLYTRSGKDKEKRRESARSAFFGSSALGRRAVEFAEHLPRSKQFDEEMQRKLDQAGWPLRSTEFLLFQVGGTVLGALIGGVLLRSWILALMLAVVGLAGPRVVLVARLTKRQSLFLSQLPDTLQLLAGSMQAGYGFVQALDTVAKEAIPPTSSEFQRVLAEARLGMPIEEALETMADRVGGEDFRWVVLAINIQRQVGGNLAQLLTTVAATLREREMVRRQIKVLSAEGRLSAVILTALPFVLVGYLSVVNPGWLTTLYEGTVGRIMIVFALALIVVGAFWMRKIIKIEV